MVYGEQASLYLDRCKQILLSRDASADQKRRVLGDLLSIVSPEQPLPAALELVDSSKFRTEWKMEHHTKMVEWLCSVFIEYNALAVATSPDLRQLLVWLIVARRDWLQAVLSLCSFERRSKEFSATYFVSSKALLLGALLVNHNVLAELIIDFATNATKTDVAFEGEIISRLVGAPDVAASLLGSEGNDLLFRDAFFYPSLIQQISIAVERLVAILRQKQIDVNMRFAGRLVGRMAARGYQDVIWTTFMSTSLSCSRLLEVDQLFVRLFSAVISNSPVGGGLENLIVALLARAPHPDHVKRILGFLIARRSDVEQLLTRHFVFSRSFSKLQFCRNLIGYIASSHAWSHMFQKLLIKLVEVWGSRVAIRHHSYDQQLYLSRLLMSSAAYLDTLKADTLCDADFDHLFRSKLIEGVTNHLDSPEGKIQTLGMVVGETLTAMLYPGAGGNPLKFEYEKTEDIVELLKMATKQEYIPWTTSEIDFGSNGDKDDIPMARSSSMSTVLNSTSSSNQEVETSYQQAVRNTITSVEKVGLAEKPGEGAGSNSLDSDDDELPPLETISSSDSAVNLGTPTTVRQCLEFLNSREQDYPNDYFDRFIVNLQALPQLIRTATVDLSEIAVEISSRLLTLECPCRMASFNSVRIDAMISMAVACPVQVAKFLTGEFFEPTYSVSHRLDILRVLTMAAEVLSVPGDTVITPTRPASKLALISEITNLCHPPETPEWRQIVEKRIREKTVYFGRQRSATQQQQKEGKNRFGKVAGDFFYPLLRRYDGTSPQLDLVNRDFMVLERFIYSLAIIFHCAADSPGHPKMAKIWLEFLLATKSHPQPVIRRAVIFSLGYVFLDVPSVLLKTEFDAEVRDASDWLVEFGTNDPDFETSRLTQNVLAHLFDALRVP